MTKVQCLSIDLDVVEPRRKHTWQSDSVPIEVAAVFALVVVAKGQIRLDSARLFGSARQIECKYVAAE